MIRNLSSMLDRYSGPTKMDDAAHSPPRVDNQAAPPLIESLGEIFSILPEHEAHEARQKALNNYISSQEMLQFEMKWADFDAAGAFCGGGASDIAGYSIRLMNEPSDDEDISRIVQLSQSSNIAMGSMEYSASENAIIWFLPNLTGSSGHQAEISYRGLFIPERIIHEILDLFAQGAQITKAEKRTVFQITAGLSLRDAAGMDGLALETKRAQLKSACAKMACGGQNDLLRNVLSKMSYLISICGSQDNRVVKVEKFVQEFLADDTRLVLQRLSNKQSIMVLERGPADGEPVMIIHGMLWPLLGFTGSADALRENNIRMVVPLRSGYLDQNSLDNGFGRKDLVHESLSNIALFQKEFLQPDVRVMGLSFGGVLALRYAKMFPQLTSRLIIAAISTAEKTPINKKFAGKFFNGLMSLSYRPGMFRYMTWQFKKYYSNEKTVRKVLHKMFGANQHDADALDGNLTGQSAYPWFVEMYQHSISGVADDFAFVMGDWHDSLGQIEQKLIFIHGENDPLMSIPSTSKYIVNCQNAELRTIPDAGHHMLATHPDQVWKLVKSL